MHDSYDRHIHYLRISVTDRCDLACTYCRDGCMPVDYIPHSQILRYEQIRDIVVAAADMGFDKIRLTGGEPLLRRDLADLVAMIRAVKGIRFIGLTTNGIRLADQVNSLKKAGLNGVNVSLDTLDPETYRQGTGGGDMTAVLQGLEAAAAAHLDVIKVNMVVTSDTTEDDIRRMQAFCEHRGFNLQRIREYHLSAREDSDHAYERPLRCGDCNRLRLTADGKLLPCLHSENEIPVDFSDIPGSLRAAVSRKPSAGSSRAVHNLSKIGG